MPKSSETPETAQPATDRPSDAANGQTPELHPVHFPETKPFSLDADYDYLREGWAQQVGYRAIRWFAHLVLPLYTRTVLGLRVHGRENLRQIGEGGFVVACNHTHCLDCTLIDCLFPFFRRRMYYATLENNFKIPVARHLIRWLGGVPLPHRPRAMSRCLEELKRALHKGDCVCVYPEGVLRPYADRLYPIRPGAFRLAVQAGVPLLPLCVTFRKSRGLHRLFRQKPLIDLHILAPLQADPTRPQREEIARLTDAYRRSMQACMEEAYHALADAPAEEAV